MALATILVCGSLVVLLFGSKGFCSYGCPYGAIFGLSDRFARGRIRVNDSCEGCGHCTATCTSNVRVHEEVARFGMVVDPGCMKCMDCVSVCPKDALHFGFGPTPERGQRARPRWDFSWAEELFMAAVVAAGILAFRNLYGAIPFLLAVGLAVIAALLGVVLLRMALKSELFLQDVCLRAKGRLTRAGLGVGAFASLFLLLACHSGFVQWHVHRAEGLMGTLHHLTRDQPQREATMRASLQHLERVERWGLHDTAELHNRMGQLLLGLEEVERAEGHLRRTFALDESILSARIRLAELLIVNDREPEAIGVLAEVLERDPSHYDAGVRLGFILERRPELHDARLLLVDLLIADDNRAGARLGLAPLLALDPPYPGASARAALLDPDPEEPAAPQDQDGSP